jgi:glycosyltransferase involved in cell wall biosynthesis
LRAVYIGSFYQGRGVDSIAELARRHADVQFLAIGGTARTSGLNPRDLGLSNLFLIDRVPHRLVGALLSHADILLMPYGKKVTVQGEGDYLSFCSPLKMFEYLAAGKAIISSRSASIEEILRDGENAIVVEADNRDAWSNAVQRLKLDPQLRAFLGRNAFAAALEHTWEARARTLLGKPEAKNGYC